MKDDSRKVVEGDTFISLNNNDTNVLDAIKRGAKKVIVQSGLYEVDTLIVKDTREYLINYLDNLYKDKFKNIKIIGITGTNGKTTSCYLIWQILNKLGYKCSYIGTIGFYIDDKISDLNNTTPDILDLYNMINRSIDEGCLYVALEVSSQALAHNRIGRLMFDYAVFTNLTEDHLDYHRNMHNYALAKQKLFNNVKGICLINYDDINKHYFLLDKNNNLTYGFTGGDYHITKYELGDISSFIMNDTLYKTNLIGKYNLYNLLIPLIILDLEHISYDKKILEVLDYPRGRMDAIKYNDNKIIVDYAHTPDAIKNIIETVRELKPNRIITIIGCGGDRDKKKRPIMASVTCTLSDYAIFTDDNPRTEDPRTIINDIIQKLDKHNYTIEENREKAIIKGIQMLSKNDILLVLGKGHEDYQIIGKEKVHFSDIEVINDNI